MNQSNIFAQAHKITKLAIANNSKVDYRATFSAVLKSIYAAIAKKKISLKKEIAWQKSKFPHIFKKTSQALLDEKIKNKFFIKNICDAIISQMPSVREKSKAVQHEAAAYYKRTGGHVTMC